ncbi:MAG: thioredoxin domain-containing protein [Deltaproteobacteria bacterium]|nr:thioredoxin domain-containing protein [Deltaproteobacteria bacterium]
MAGLLLAFALASYVYTSQQADRIEALAAAADSPLERPHSRSGGPPDARVVLVEFFDPACETCRTFAPQVKSLLASHPNRVRLVLRYAPFHQGSDTMVKILEAAGRQGLFWETLQVMYETQPQWASHHHPQPEKIWEFLPRAGVDVSRIRRDMNDPMFVKLIEQDLADGRTLGVRKTPQFFVNGSPLLSFGYRQLKSMLDTEVAKQYPQ